LSAINFAGTARTDVAVGTSSEDVMFFTTAAATPRNVVVVNPSPSASCAARAAFAAFAATMSSGVAVVVGRAGRDRRGGGGGGGGPAGRRVDDFEGTVDIFGSSALDVVGGVDADAVAISAVAELLEPVCAKKSRQVESTLAGSARKS